MATHAKFLFDTVFGGHDAGAQAPAEPVFRADDVEAARLEAYQRGLIEGRQAALAEASSNAQSNLAQIAQHAEHIAADLSRERERMEAEATGLALAAARCLAPALIAREPHEELIALFRDCIANLTSAPHLVIRVPGGNLAELRQNLEKIAFQAGHDGRIIVLEEDGIGPGDCRIEWADGGIARSSSDLTRAICDIVARRHGPAAILAVEPDLAAAAADMPQPPLETRPGSEAAAIQGDDQ